jgi:hypothetical protein
MDGHFGVTASDESVWYPAIDGRGNGDGRNSEATATTI